MQLLIFLEVYALWYIYNMFCSQNAIYSSHQIMKKWRKINYFPRFYCFGEIIWHFQVSKCFHGLWIIFPFNVFLTHISIYRHVIPTSQCHPFACFIQKKFSLAWHAVSREDPWTITTSPAWVRVKIWSFSSRRYTNIWRNNVNQELHCRNLKDLFVLKIPDIYCR